jgi:ATP-binding cassette subfamily F protein uup
LEVAYFDQLRAQLDDEKSVQDNVADGSDKVEINGSSKHVISYLQDFLFTPDRVRQPVKALSGGERNRLLLARLFSKSANVLVMDEPTNDLDVETLELLEELLLDYKGTLLLVSHDRVFLNNVVTSTLVFEGEGRVNEYVGGYDDWLSQRKVSSAETVPKPPVVKPERDKREPVVASSKPKKLSYKDQRELDTLPKLIEQLEGELEKLQMRVADPAFYKRPKEDKAKVQQQLQETEAALNEAYGRWEALES